MLGVAVELEVPKLTIGQVLLGKSQQIFAQL